MGTKEAKEEQEKPLDRMTVKELREVALKIPEITGVHGMKKDELLSAIKKAQGIAEDTTKESDTPKKVQKTPKDKTKKADISIQEIKNNITELKAKKIEALKSKDSHKAKIFRRRISRLKKKTRRAA